MHGLIDISEAEYHADPCPEPSLSSSIATVMMERSPLHAWHQHPRLNPDFEPEERNIFDKGRVAHKVIVEGSEDGILIFDYPDWRTAEAKKNRDYIRKEGLTPILRHQFDEVSPMIDMFNESIWLPKSQREQTIVWEEDGFWFRIRVDILPHEGPTFYDYKTTQLSAGPGGWGRRNIWNYMMQMALYCRGVHKVLGWQNPEMQFIVQENTPPYAVCTLAADEDGRMAAEVQLDRVIEEWKDCLTHDEWPGYGGGPHYVFAPSWITEVLHRVD